MLWVAYHILFGTIRMLVDLKYPNGSSSNTVVAFGMNLRSAIFSLPEGSDKWVLRDTQPEKQQPDVSGFRLTGLDENVYDYEIEMGLFYQYKMFYIYGAMIISITLFTIFTMLAADVSILKGIGNVIKYFRKRKKL